MPRGRPKKAHELIPWTIYVPEDLATKVDLFHLDPVFGRVRYGSRTALVNKLLRQWLAERALTSPFPPSEEDE